MDFKFFLLGIKNIILNPAKVLDTIVTEKSAVRLLRNSFLFPLIILVTVSSFFGSWIFSNSELSLIYSVFVGIKCFVLLYLTVYVTSLLLGEITYPLDLGKDFNKSFILIVYSMAPFLTLQILTRLLESLVFINIIGLFGLYIFWIGAEKVLNPPAYKKMPLLIATSVTLIGIYILTNILLDKLIDRIYFAYFA